MKHVPAFISFMSLLILTGCSTLQPHKIVNEYEARLTLNHLQQRVTPIQQPIMDLDSILVLDDEIKTELLNKIPLRLSENRRFNRLVTYFNDPNGLGLTYANNKTLSASQTFYQRQGNCLAMASLFVAMARTLKLEANINEVHIPPLWQNPQNNTYQLVLHVNAIVKLKQRNSFELREKIVEFNSDNYNPYRQQKTISDQRLAALFASNLAIEAMLENQDALAIEYLNKAIKLESQEPIFWTNLGTLLRRTDNVDSAETVLLYSLNLDPENDMASSALSRLYKQQGKTQLASRYLENAMALRANNPYIKIEKAKNLYSLGKYKQAIGLIYQAIEKQKYEHEFYRLLGLCYMQLAEYEYAKNSFTIAKALANTPKAMQIYQSKLDLMVKL